MLGVEVPDLARSAADLRVSASRARSSRPISSDFCACAVSLSDWVLQLVALELDPLAAGRHVGDPAAYLGQHLELALIAVVERLSRVLGLVEGLLALARKIMLIRFIMLMAINLPGRAQRNEGDRTRSSSRTRAG